MKTLKNLITNCQNLEIIKVLFNLYKMSQEILEKNSRNSKKKSLIPLLTIIFFLTGKSIKINSLQSQFTWSLCRWVVEKNLFLIFAFSFAVNSSITWLPTFLSLSLFSRQINCLWLLYLPNLLWRKELFVAQVLIYDINSPSPK